MTKEKLRALVKPHHCTVAELAKLSNVPFGDVERYVEMGVLPYIQVGKPLTMYFHKTRSKKRLREIRELEKQGATPDELKKRYPADVENHLNNLMRS